MKKKSERRISKSRVNSLLRKLIAKVTQENTLVGKIADLTAKIVPLREAKITSVDLRIFEYQQTKLNSELVQVQTMRIEAEKAFTSAVERNVRLNEAEQSPSLVKA